MAPTSAVHSEQAAIRHGLQAGPSQPHLSAVDKAPSGAGGSAPSDSPLGWTLQSVMNASLHATLTAPNPVSEVGSAESEVMEAVLTELMADEVVVLELQNALGSLPAQANPETVAAVPVAQQRVTFHGVQGVVPVPPAPLVAPLWWQQQQANLIHGQSNATPEQQAIGVQVAQTDVEVCNRSLARWHMRLEPPERRWRPSRRCMPCCCR